MVKHYPPQNIQLNTKLRPIARQMRHEPTQAEALLWDQLRARRLCGYRFHRQHVIDRFIVDFYCSKAALIIEVDGPVHQKQVDADREREIILTGLGYQILRFTNSQVKEQIEEVLQFILISIRQAEVDKSEGTPSSKSGFGDFGEGAGDEDIS